MMKFMLSFLALLTSFVFEGAQAQTQNYIVEFKRPLVMRDLVSLKKYYPSLKIKKFDHVESSYFKRLYEVSLSSHDQRFFKNNPNVTRIESIYLSEESSLTPAGRGFSQDPFSHWQWGIYNQGQSVLQDIDDLNSLQIQGKVGFDLGLSPVRAQLPSLMKKDVLVAVVDSGVDLDHEDLKDNLYRNTLECKNGELPFGILTDKDKNGFAGDCMGWNFVSNNNRPYDDKGHGTHVAGIISAVSDNGKGISGLVGASGFKIKILPIKVYQGSEGTQNGSLGAFTDKIAKGILYAAKMKVDVINLSLGWPRVMDTEYLRQAVAFAQAQGVTIVAAAGNNGHSRPLYPCSYEGVICVGASSVNGQAASFSNYGGHVDLVAPGEQILSTFPKKIEPSFFSVLGYEIKNGTSQAAPFVSGIVAYLKSYKIGMSEDEIYARLISSGEVLEPTEKFFLGGQVNVGRALEDIQKPLILPKLKKISQVTYSASDKRFSFELEVKNFGMLSKEGSLKISTDHSFVIFDQNEFVLPSLSQGGRTTFQIQGTLRDLSSDSRLRLNISIFDGDNEKSFQHELVLVRSLLNDVEVKKVLIEDKGLLNELMVSSKDGFLGRLRTIEDPYRTKANPEYYFERLNPETKKMELWIFQYREGRLIPLKVSISGAQKVSYVRSLDLNYDGVLDYFVESRTATATTLIYSFLKNDLSPLLGGGHWKYEIKDAYSLPGKMAFIPRQVTTGRILAMPVFLDKGLIPENQKNPDSWDSSSQGLDLHLYALVPDFIKNELRANLLDSYIFQKRLENELGKKWDESFSYLGQGAESSTLLYQSEKDFQDKKARFLFSLGIPNSKRYYEGIVSSDGKIDFLQRDISENDLERAIRLSLTDVDTQAVRLQSGSVFAQLQGVNIGHMTFIDGETTQALRYDHPWGRDTLVAAMGAFRKDEQLISYYQSKGKVIRYDSLNHSTSYPIERVSFVTGAAFNELFFPLVHAREIFFYVDATKIHTGHVYLLKDTGRELVSPLRNNVVIPAQCVAMNPVKYQGTESMSFLCKEKNTLLMNFISL